MVSLGRSGYVSFDSNNYFVSDGYTLEVWARVDQLPIDSAGIVGQFGAGRGYGISVERSGGDEYRFVFHAFNTNGRRITMRSDEYRQLGVWHHIAATYDFTGSDTAILYVDGLEVERERDLDGPTQHRISIEDALVLLAGGEPFDFSPMAGSVAEVRLWDTVRTPSEIIRQRFTQVSDTIMRHT